MDVDISIGQREQRRMQRMLGVSEDGVPPVRLLHSFHIQTALLLTTEISALNIKKVVSEASHKQKIAQKEYQSSNGKKTAGCEKIR